MESVTRKMCQRDKVWFCSVFLQLCENSQISNIIIKDPMEAMDAPKEIFMIAIKEPLSAKGDLYDCNQRAPVVSPSNSIATMVGASTDRTSQRKLR